MKHWATWALGLALLGVGTPATGAILVQDDFNGFDTGTGFAGPWNDTFPLNGEAFERWLTLSRAYQLPDSESGALRVTWIAWWGRTHLLSATSDGTVRMVNLDEASWRERVGSLASAPPRQPAR